MLNSIIEAISISLNDEFGDKYPIYTEEVEQDCKKPCFFILPVSQDIKEELSGGAKKSITLDIIFYPGDKFKTGVGALENREILKMSSVLLEKMKILDVEGRKLRGTDISSETTGEILNFIVTYSYRFIRREKTEHMQKLKQKGDLKNG